MGSAEAKEGSMTTIWIYVEVVLDKTPAAGSSPPLKALLGHSVVPHLGHYFVEKDPVSSPIVAIKKAEL